MAAAPPPPDAKGSSGGGGGALEALAIIPARLDSSRLARKMLLRETGRFLFEHTVRNVQRCRGIGRVVLATDSGEILDAAREVGIEAFATDPAHPSGTDRVHEALQTLVERGEGPWDVVVNVQGDEPELPTRDLDTLLRAFRDPAVEMATLWAPVATRAEADDPSVVKVVVDAAGNALYFSRSPIPSLDHPTRPMDPASPGLSALKRHVGVYGFRPEALARFCALPRGHLETTESLEQLRWLEAGRAMRVVEASQTTIGIDTREHYAGFVARHSHGSSLQGTKTP